MLSPSQLQFRLMALDAQRAAVQRLALRGWDVTTISLQTGMPEADVHDLLAGTGSQGGANSGPPTQTPLYKYWRG